MKLRSGRTVALGVSYTAFELKVGDRITATHTARTGYYDCKEYFFIVQYVEIDFGYAIIKLHCVADKCPEPIIWTCLDKKEQPEWTFYLD